MPPAQQSPTQPWPQQQPWAPPAALQQQQQQQWAPQPQQQWAPPSIPGPGLGTHLKRAFDWNVAAITPTPREQQHLDAAGVEPRLRGLFVWRRSTLIAALPILLLSVVLAFVEAGKNDTTGFTGFGKLLNWLPPIALIFPPLGAWIVIRKWTELRRSSKALLVCWVVSIAIPLFVALMPLDFLIDIGSARQSVALNGGDVDVFDAEVFVARLTQAMQFALTLLPVVLSIPGGVLKGASRIKSLFPSASLPGWFLVAVAPFYSMFMIVVFVLVDQIVGNALLLLAVGILAFTPWLFVIHRKVYGRPLSMAESRTELARASRAGGWLTLAGIGILAIYGLTAKVQGAHVVGGNTHKSYFSYVQVLRTLGEVLSRGLVTAVVFSTIFLYLVYAEWRTMTQMSGEIRREHDEQIGALQHYMARPGA
jgi:hypothetical protein